MEFYFNFISSGFGIKQIDEPFGLDAVPFGIKQDEGRKGRDVLYAGSGDAKLSITTAVDRYGFYFERVLREWLRYGFEYRLEFMVDYGNGIEVIGDCAEFEWDGGDTINFIVRQKLAEAKFKLNYETETDLKSNTDVEGNPITPPTPELFLLKAKPVLQISEWDNPTLGRQMLFDNPPANPDYFNPIKNQVQFEIQNSLSWLIDGNDSNNGAFSNFRYINFSTNAIDINVEINLNIVYDYLPQFNNTLTDGKNGQILLRLYHGQAAVVGQFTQVNVWNSQVFQGTTNGQQVLNTTFNIPIASLNTTDNIWMSFVSATGNGAVNRITFYECSVKITVASIALNTIFKAYRYIDAIKYCVKSASGLDVYAPDYDFGGELYNTFITVPSLMRRLEDKPVNLNCKEFLEEHISPEINGGHEIDALGRLFIGRYRDFYRNYEIGNFEQDKLEPFKQSINEKYKIKRIKNGFKYFASQKESETENTYDIVHGDAQHITPNQNVSNEREALVGFIRDAYQLALTQRKSYDTSKSAATQDDDKKYLIDAVPLYSGTNFTETFELQHLYDPDGNRLILRNTGAFTFDVLEIGIGTSFTILNTDNAGVYNVLEVNPTEIILAANAGVNLIANTTVKYFISQNVFWTNRTDEGFTTIQGLVDGDNYSNLLYTTKRILMKYYAEEVATMCLYRPDEEVRNTLYNNNPDCVTLFEGESAPIREGQNYIPTGAILTPYEYQCTLLMTFQEFWDMQTLLRTERGFIRTWFDNGLPLKGYIKQGEFTLTTTGEAEPDERWGKFECTLEEKYEPFYMEIYAQGSDFIINGEVQPTGFSFSYDNMGYFSFFDSRGKLLHTPIPYDRIKLNNAGAASSPEELGVWLSQFDIQEI